MRTIRMPRGERAVLNLRGFPDLPRRWTAGPQSLLIQGAVAFAGIAVAVGLRLILDQVAPGLVPFALTFPVLVVVGLVAGAWAGAITLVGCQLLIWYAVLPPRFSFAITSLTTLLDLLLVTLAQIILLWSVTAYRSVMEHAQRENRQRIEDLSLALREIDHRTRNNFALAIGMLEIEARNAEEATLRSGLNRAAARLQAIAGAYKNLALSSVCLEAVRLHDYLNEMCGRLREGMLSPAVSLQLECDQVTVPPQFAVRVGLIVNEVVTNAAKHAFPEGVGSITVKLEKKADLLSLCISDDGKGIDADGPVSQGLGSKLIAMLVRQLAAKMQCETRSGTHYEFIIPHEAGA